MKALRITFLVGIMVLVIAGHAMTARADIPEGFQAAGQLDVFVTTNIDGQKVIAQTQCYKSTDGKDTYCETEERLADSNVASK